MRHYKYLTIEEREKLYLMKNLGQSNRKIAQELGRSPSTISRELKRGRCSRHPYMPSTAQIRYRTRKQEKGEMLYATVANPIIDRDFERRFTSTFVFYKRR